MVQGQWRVGFSGVVAADYAGWEAILRPFGLWRPEVIQSLQAFEVAALRQFADRAKAQEYYSDTEYAEWVEREVARAKG